MVWPLAPPLALPASSARLQHASRSGVAWHALAPLQLMPRHVRSGSRNKRRGSGYRWKRPRASQCHAASPLITLGARARVRPARVVGR